MAADVEEAFASGQAQPAVTVKKVAPSSAPVTQKAELPDHMFTDIENSQIRKVIAERLTFSK